MSTHLQLRDRLCIVLLFLIAALPWAVGSARAQGPAIVRIVYFSSQDCIHCTAITNEVLKPLQDKYGDQLQIKTLEVSDPANYEILIRAEEMFQVPPEKRGLPTLIIDGQVLVGEDEIRQQLPCLLDTCLGAGGTSWPAIPGLDAVAVTGPGEPGPGEPGLGLDPGVEIGTCTTEQTVACEGPAPMWVAYFYQVGCQECSRAEYDIRYVRSKYPQFLVEEYDLREDAALLEWLGARLGVPEQRRLVTPALFVGQDYLIGTDVTAEAVLALAEKYAPTGAEKVWAAFAPQEAEQSIVERFKSLGALTVVLAGLVDGINPCAFATLVFFISYLAFLGRKGPAVIAVGAAFTLGVFLTYTLVGLGLWRLLSALPFLATLGRWVYGLTALICGLLAVFSLIDYLKARRGQIEDMALVMPEVLRRRVHGVIRHASTARAFVLVALPTGAAISFLELACTGQVYLPTIIFVMSVPQLQARAALFLLLYNLMFILPLVVVFGLTYWGTTSLQLGLFLRRHVAKVKLGTALLFAALAAWLIVALVA